MNKIKRISLIALCLPFLFSCSNYSNNNNYIEDDNKILVKDFTYKDARMCFDYYVKNNINVDYIDNSFGVDIYYYLGRGINNNGYILIISSFNPLNNLYETKGIKADKEILKIKDLEINWSNFNFNNVIGSYIPLFVSNNDVLYLDEAYNKNFVDYSILKNVIDICEFNLNEYYVGLRFLKK